MADIFAPTKQRPAWAIAGLPDGVTVRRIDLQPPKKGFGGDTMLFNGKVIGKSAGCWRTMRRPRATR